MTKKEVRICLLVVLGVAFVSLFTQIIAGISAACTLFNDAKKAGLVIDSTRYDNAWYIDKSAGFIIGMTVVAAIFIAALIFALLFKKKKFVGFSVFTAVFGVAFIIFIALTANLRSVLPVDKGTTSYYQQYNILNYSIFQQFLTIGIADAVAMLLVWLAWFLLEFEAIFPIKEKDSSQIVQLAIENIKINQEDDDEQEENAVEITTKGWKKFFKRKNR